MLDTRAERTSDLAFYDTHGITHRKFLVPDVTVPDEAVLTEAVAWIDDQLADDRTVLIHCAKGRGRSATVLAAYLMKTEGMSFEAVRDLLQLEAGAGQARGPAPPRAGVLGRHRGRTSRQGVNGRRPSDGGLAANLVPSPCERTGNPADR